MIGFWREKSRLDLTEFQPLALIDYPDTAPSSPSQPTIQTIPYIAPSSRVCACLPPSPVPSSSHLFSFCVCVFNSASQPQQAVGFLLFFFCTICTICTTVCLPRTQANPSTKAISCPCPLTSPPPSSSSPSLQSNSPTLFLQHATIFSTW